MAELELPKLLTRVRFPSLAPCLRAPGLRTIMNLMSVPAIPGMHAAHQTLPQSPGR